MKQYEYKFIQVPVAWNTQGIISRPPKAGSTFDACKDVIEKEAANGWRFKQIVIPFCLKPSPPSTGRTRPPTRTGR